MVPKEQNPSARYLDYLLEHRQDHMDTNDPVILYFMGKGDRKETLDNAGVATSPEKARQQICATAFWMALWQKGQGESKKGRELLKIAIKTEESDLTEYQLASWLLRQEDSL